MNINLDSAKDILCKNITIYGYCKFENKGCVFSHRPKESSKQQQQSSSQQPQSSQQQTPQQQQQQQPPNSAGSITSTQSTDSKKKFNVNTPSFQPSLLKTATSSSTTSLTNKFANLSPKLNDIPVFKPESNEHTGPKFNASTPSFVPGGPQAAMNNNNNTAGSTPIAAPAAIAGGVGSAIAPQPVSTVPPHVAAAAGIPPSQSPNPYLADSYYQQQTTYPLQYHLYAPAPPPRLSIPLAPHETNSKVLFIPNDLRETLHRKNEATLQTMSHSTLPETVNSYHSLVPIDRSYDQEYKWKWKSSLYKVFGGDDGQPYAMRKIDTNNLENLNSIEFKKFKIWKSLDCSNVVKVIDGFTSLSFGSPGCLIVVYDYYPNSHTLLEHHHKKLVGKPEPINEEILWNYLIQLINALKHIHAKGLAARTAIDLSKIIVTNKDRIRISSVAISDILEEDEGDITQLQLDDFRNIGKCLVELSLLTLPIHMRTNTTNTFQALKMNLSEEYVDMIQSLVQVNSSFDVEAYHQKLTTRLFNTVDKLQDCCDFMENQLTSELENARLFRLMTKINFVTATTNTHKIIKLFYDYVFNSYHETTGKRVVDLSKVLINLNKLDCGIDEKLLLVNNEENECIIASYKEIRDIIDSSFRIISRD
ncbi:PAN3 [[Candida] subhashii]|uniref:PAN2-PAN3 deadenylation complex subunit PAN3 n=1 Tax=[Candida] subhashii TaxID=561895 RepID=A0A8J5V5Z9_9ASCO|nr:PAN3 [[Candida] subhashii]KAG7666379.1 PAN3 [[Candida] subhashii]